MAQSQAFQSQISHSADRNAPDGGSQDPLILTIPGLNNSGPGHWQSRWEQDSPDCRRVELGMWDRPHRNTWVNKLNLAIHRLGDRASGTRPVILVAHSLGCLAVAWWAEYERPRHGDPVVGALLVAPPDVDRDPCDQRLARFAPTPDSELPFPSILVASRDDPYSSLDHARRLARGWGSRLVDAGKHGHLNAASRLGNWPFGQELLGQLVGGFRRGPGFSRAVQAGIEPETSNEPGLVA